MALDIKGSSFAGRYKRVNGYSIDSTDVWETLEEARVYARNTDTEPYVPYAGQVVSVIENGTIYKLVKDDTIPETDGKKHFKLAIIGSNNDNDDRYVRKDIAETIEKLMTFLEGINAKGTSTLEQIKLVGDILSSNFATGSTGFGIYKDEQGNYHLDIDFVDIRKRLNVESLQVNQATYVGGKQYNSDGIICNKVEDKGTFWRCYFRTTDAEGRIIYNPFEATVASGAEEQAIIEKIDIGGISLIRAAAKNFNDVVIIASQAQYKPFRDMLLEHGATTSREERRWFAKEAFAVSSHYDSAIFNYFDGGEGSAFRCAMEDQKQLRYGENPHQKGYFYGNLDAMFDQIHGKEISYNNLLDINAAVDLIDEFDEITFAILKHNNACGLASRPTVLEAWKDALAGDPVSAFGGVLVTNAVIDKETAEEINKLFFEVIIAPDYDVDALEILGQKKNRIILVRKEAKLPKKQFRSLLNGVLVQERDLDVETAADLKQVSEKAPTAAEVEDMLFANKIVKNSKSNAIVLAKNKQLLASGVGQTSRVDALKQAIEKAKSFEFDLHGAVMASDAFFPFPDCVEIADKEGVKAVIQPGGSVKDELTFQYCNEHGVAMVTTGIRHFKH